MGVLSRGSVPARSERDYDAVGVPYEERWERFDELVAILRSLLRGDPVLGVPPPLRVAWLAPGAGSTSARRDPLLWIGSWGSKAGLRGVARLGDGWLASAYNTTPDSFKAAKESLSERLDSHGRDPGERPESLAAYVDLGHRG